MVPCRFISRLRVLEADWIVEIIHGVIGQGVLVRVGVEGYFLLNGCRRYWLLHMFLLILILLHWGWWWWWHHDLSLDGPGWVVNKAVGVPVGVTVVLHALEDADGSWGRLLDKDRWRWGRLLWWRWRRLRHCYRSWWSLLRGAVGVVAGVAEHGDGTSGQVDNVGLAQGVFVVAQVKNVRLGNGWSRRKRRWGCSRE